MAKHLASSHGKSASFPSRAGWRMSRDNPLRPEPRQYRSQSDLGNPTATRNGCSRCAMLSRFRHQEVTDSDDVLAQANPLRGHVESTFKDVLLPTQISHDSENVGIGCLGLPEGLGLRLVVQPDNFPFQISNASFTMIAPHSRLTCALLHEWL